MMRVIERSAFGAMARLEHPLKRLFWFLRAKGDPNDWRTVRRNAFGIRYIPLTTEDSARSGSRERILNMARRYPERNWPKGSQIVTADGAVEDTIPEDQSLVVDTGDGLLVVAGCAHAGIGNILAQVREMVPGVPIRAVVGGLHLLDADETSLAWTAERMREAGLRQLLGAHCTGLEAVRRSSDSTKSTVAPRASQKARASTRVRPRSVTYHRHEPCSGASPSTTPTPGCQRRNVEGRVE